MKVWKIVSGVLSVVISLFVVFQSFFAGAYNILTGNGQSSGTAGVVVAMVMFTGGIVALATSSGSRGGDAAIAILYGIGALTGFFGAGSYLDLYVWASWCLLCAILALVDFVRISRYDDEEEDVAVTVSPTANVRSGPATFQDVILEPDPRRRDAAIDALPEPQAKSYLKQALNVLVPRQMAGSDEDNGLVRALIAILAVLGVFLIGVVGLGIFLSIDKNDRTASSAPPTESRNIRASEPVQTTPPAAANLLTVGDNTILGHWEIAVTDFYYTGRIETSPYTAFTPDEGNQYAVVAARITNNGTESDTFLPSISMTDDVRTAVHYADEYVYSSSYLLGVIEDLHDSSLNPLTSKDGIIAFSVPDVVANSEESLSVTFSAGRDEVTFRLR
ncbi:MAG: DUF4352 domain-containing protein [Clostridiales bacterium]|nr:DUF4352 domain-containing protein [Clostridiales bacterium]